MLALIGNLSVGEIIVIAVLSILIFGGRLPEVAARAVHYFRQFRRGLDDLKRETGIDRELRNIEYEIRDAERAARKANPFSPQPPPGLRNARTDSGATPLTEGTPPRVTPGESGETPVVEAPADSVSGQEDGPESPENNGGTESGSSGSGAE